MTDIEIRTQLISLILGGNETTRHLIGNLLVRLATDPALFAELKADPSLVAAAVDESLRLDPPVHQMLRTVEVEIDRFGPTMCPGDKIIYAVSSANRDAAVFDGPSEFRLDRDNGRDHLAFGDGPHVCPGRRSPGSRAGVTIEELLRGWRPIEPEPGWEPRKVPIFWANGPVDVRVRLTAG